jgi:hypothetical protein
MHFLVVSFFDELEKLGAVSDDQARRSLDRLDQLEKNTPTPGQVGRYGALGAGAGALGHVVSRAIEGGAKGITRRSALGAAAAGAIGMGAVPLVRGALDRHAEKKTLSAYLRQPDKTAASAPTRGNFMQASDIPSFRAPQLSAAIQKTGDLETPDANSGPIPGALKKNNEEPEKEKNSDALPNFVTYSPGDFKRSKYAGLKHAVAGLTPASQLEKSTSIGAPKVSAPPGPSIADQVKPRGKAFGIGMPGAFKGTIG